MQEGIAERERQLAHNALHDALTGLPNRTLALERLGSAISAARPTALLHIGVGNFRTILDSCGADGADLALQQLSRRLQATLRPGDSLARLVNDEMLLMLENSDSDNAIAAADRLHQLLLKPMRVGTLDVALDCSIGIATYPAHGNNPDDLLRRAAIAMQDAAQQSGRLVLYQEPPALRHGVSRRVHSAGRTHRQHPAAHHLGDRRGAAPAPRMERPWPGHAGIAEYLR
jgi:diguanylate cyclase (GGDEF)-like protein